MPKFIGFSTINRYKKFTVTDYDLIKQDLLNALNIRQGELPGRPGFGTTIWEYVFEPQTQDVLTAMEQEMQRVCGSDPRLYIERINTFPQENGVLIEVLLSVVPSTDTERLAIFLDQEVRNATYV